MYPPIITFEPSRTISLLKNTVFGIFNTASKITGSISKVAEIASFDDKWQRERELERLKGKPAHVGEGLIAGVTGFGIGIFKGVTGIFESPVEGYNKEGGLGLLKGIGKGATGLVLKPVVGAVDLVTKTTEGIKNTTIFFEEQAKNRVRLPRHFSQEKILEVWNKQKSEAYMMLKTIERGKYNNDMYIYSEIIGIERINSVKITIWVIISDEHLMQINAEDTKTFTLTWIEHKSNVQSISLFSGGVTILLRNKDSKVIYCPSVDLAETIAKIITTTFYAGQNNVRASFSKKS